MTYRRGERNTVRDRFKAVTRDDTFEIMFFGQFRDRGAQLEGGEAVNEDSRTFIFLGHRNAACQTPTDGRLQAKYGYTKE